MKIGIYSPYLDTVGGGEKYMLTIAEGLSKENEVDVFLDSHLQTLDIKLISEKIYRLLNLDLSKINFIKAPFGKGTKIWDRLNFLKKYDLFFSLTDGSVFYSSARTSVLHIQSPIKVTNSSLWNKIKQSSWDLIIYNSAFTKTHSEKFWKIKGEIVYPPVETGIFKPGKKKKQILTVGRFYGFLKDKQSLPPSELKQSMSAKGGKKRKLMIDSFKKLVDSGKAKDWSFYLAGGAGEGDMEFIKELRESAKGYPVHIYPNLDFNKLVKAYSESSIYWHAAGFEETDPAKMEHFGITTVEAMASGCVPVVINLGGQREIVDEEKNGLLWDSPEEMEEKTIKLINDEKLMSRLSQEALDKSKQFSKEKFIVSINDIVKKYAAI